MMWFVHTHFIIPVYLIVYLLHGIHKFPNSGITGTTFSFIGLCPVRQTMRKFEPIDELRRASFRLEAGVAEYRLVDCGVEVDIWFKALRADHPVWESVVTMLSPRDFPVLNVQSLSNGVDGKGNQPGIKTFLILCWTELKTLKLIG